MMQSVPPVLLNFFARFFQQWNGSGQRSYILQILAYAPLLEFQGIHLLSYWHKNFCASN